MREEIIDAFVDQVFDAIVETVKKSNFKLKTKNKEEGIIKASVGMNRRSWGENITIKVSTYGTKTKISVQSKNKIGDLPKKNEINEDKIIKGIDELLPNSREIGDTIKAVRMAGSDENNNIVILTLNNDKVELKKKGTFTGRDRGNQFIKLEDITNIDFKKGLVFGTVKLMVPGGKIKIKNASPKEAAVFVSSVKEKIMQKLGNDNISTEKMDPLEKIKKSKDLLDMGAISQEEFDEIKDKLLKEI